MKRRYFVVLLVLLIVSSFPMFGQQQVSIRGSLALGTEVDIVNGFWNFGYGAVFVEPGTPWQLTLSGADPNTVFALCSTKDDQNGGCAPNYGHTDQNGNWQLEGAFDTNSVGNWTEWIQFPSGAISNRISFGVGTTYPTGRLQINGAEAGVFHANQPWTLVLDQASHYNQPFDFCFETGGVSAGCVPNFGNTDGTASWTLTGVFPSGTIGGWSEWIRFKDGTTSNRISFTVDNSPLDDLTCPSGTIYPIGPNAGYANFPRFMPDWYPSNSGDYQMLPGYAGGAGNTLEYYGCGGGGYVWLQWAYGSFFGFEVRSPWSGQTDRGLRIGDPLVKFKSLYPAAQLAQGTASHATSSAWDNGPLRIFIQNGTVVGIRVNWTISEFSPNNQQGPFIASPGPTWFVF